MTIHALRPLTPAALLRATAPRLGAMHDAAAHVLAARLRHHAPDLTRTSIDLEDAARDIVQALTDAAPAIDTPDLSRDALGALALRLRERGLTLRVYVALHAAFLDMLADRLGADPALMSAWKRALSTLLATMMTAAHGPRRATGPLAA